MEKVWEGIFFVWLFLVTGLVGWLTRKIQKITRDFSKEGFKSATDLSRRTAELEKKTGVSFQKIGLVRFNSFPGVGGDQSFSLVLLDEKSNGVVITSLHYRDSTRLYVKELSEGQSYKQELAEEEKRAIKIAQKKGRGKNEK